MSQLRRGAAFRPLFPQAPRPAGRVGCGVSPTIQLLLRGGELPSARDAAIATVFGAQGLRRPGRGGGVGLARWRDAGGQAPAARLCRCKPPHGHALAPLVVRDVRRARRSGKACVAHCTRPSRRTHYQPHSWNALPAIREPDCSAYFASSVRSRGALRCTLCNGQERPAEDARRSASRCALRCAPCSVQQRCGHDDRRRFTDPRTLGALSGVVSYPECIRAASCATDMLCPDTPDILPQKS